MAACLWRRSLNPMTDISVVMPVGPHADYKEFLWECYESVVNQTHAPNEIIIVDDRANIPLRELYGILKEPGWGNEWCDKCYDRDGYVFKTRLSSQIRLVWYRTLWNVGVADAFNFGIAMSESNLVFTIGSDDKMMPPCLEECVKAYEEHQIEGWYNVTHITEGGEVGAIPNNTAMITKELWRYTGGFPPSAGVAACDALLLSILMKHAPERIIQVQEGTPLCWLREGDYQDTRKNAWYYAQSGVVEQIRNMETVRWKPKN